MINELVGVECRERIAIYYCSRWATCRDGSAGGRRHCWSCAKCANYF